MAKKAYDGSISYLRRDIDWGVGDPSTMNLPLSGKTVQQYIKDNFDHKAGWFETHTDKSACFVFASQADASLYWTDTSLYADLLLGQFATVNDYELVINVTNPSSKSKTLFTNTKDSQKIIFDWDIKTKSSQISQDESVKCTYTFTREGYTNSYVVFYSALQKHVEVDITEYLQNNNAYVEGETTVTILLEGQTHAVVSSSIISYKVVNFSFSIDDFNISETHSPDDTITLGWHSTGTGSKKIYLFIDGNLYAKDAIGSDQTIGTKSFSCNGLENGRHNFIIYSSISFDGATYYFSDVISRDFIVKTNSYTGTIFTAAIDIPIEYLPNIKDSDMSRTDCYPAKIFDMEQYVQYKLKIGAYGKDGYVYTTIKLNDKIVQSEQYISNNNPVEVYILSEDAGTKTLKIEGNGISYNIPTVINTSGMDIQETHADNVEFFFSADGKSNDSVDRDQWSYVKGSTIINASFNGDWNWNTTSGWINNGLLIDADSSISFNYAPFDFNDKSKTFEIELEARNVSDDDTSICVIQSGNANFVIKANAVSLTSSNSVNLITKFKSEDRVRISLVIDNTTKMTYVYVNGIMSGGAYYGSGNYRMINELSLTGNKYAQVWVKQIRVYNIALTADEILKNYIRYRDNIESMKSIYNKNDIIDVLGSISKDMILKNLRLPVMTVIGKYDNMPAVKWLDTIAGKSDQVDVNVLFENPLDPETSFYAEHITMTPQGTSSMVYPKRNYRLYSAYDKLVKPDEFKMWYTHGYDKIQRDKWTEILPNSKGNRKYRFKAGSQKAVRWTIKADFAESSGTHNTGVARLWNAAMRNAKTTYEQAPEYYYRDYNSESKLYYYVKSNYNELISKGAKDDTIEAVKSIPTIITENSPLYIKILGNKSVSGSQVTETHAQYCAKTYEYEDGKTFEQKEGEVRTCVDGYPIAMFYQESENSTLVFMGKYNFNNDKSSKSIFGFEEITSFDEDYNKYYKPGTPGKDFFDPCDSSTASGAEQYKSSMQCWELTNSGDHIALFIDKPQGGADFRSGFEARYPSDDGEDTEITRFNTYVKPFAEWMVGIREDASTVIVREHEGQPASYTYADWNEVTQEYVNDNIKDASTLHSIEYWINDASMEADDISLYSVKLTNEEVEEFPNIDKLIQYKKINAGTDITNLQFVIKNGRYYEQLVKTESNPIKSWTNCPRFKTEKWDHFDIFKIAAYYIYLMRFGAVDQTVKNAMFTSEDGRHWYYINYDNDTILGLRNDGRLMYDPMINRQSWDPGISDYSYAGYESTLWNALENDDEFMNEVVPAVDDALFKTGGLSYSNTINEMNVNQCQKWCEKIYNKDAQYKYVDSFLQDSKNYLDSMQGSRESHRRWWLSKRFSYYDARFANTSYTGNYMYVLAPGVTQDKTFKIVAGDNTYYSIGVNNRLIKTQDNYSLPINLKPDETFNFRCPGWTLQVGSPVNIYAVNNIKELDFSQDYGQFISQINFHVGDSTEGSKLEKLILNGNNPNTSYAGNSAITTLNYLKQLKYLDVKNIKGVEANPAEKIAASPVTELNGLNELQNLETFIATGSNIDTVEFAAGAPLKTAKLSSKTSKLTLKELSNLNWNGIKFGTSDSAADKNKLIELTINRCPELAKSFVKIYEIFKAVRNSSEYDPQMISYTIDNIAWTGVDPSDLIDLGSIIENNGTLKLTGTIRLTNGKLDINLATKLKSIYGNNIFNPENDLYITDQNSVFIIGDSSIIEGNSTTYEPVILTGDPYNYSWSVDPTREDYTINSSTGVLSTQEIHGMSDVNVQVVLNYFDNRQKPQTKTKDVSIIIPTYPSIDKIHITGNATVNESSAKYTVNIDGSGYTGKMKYQWSLLGFNSGEDASIISRSDSSTVSVGFDVKDYVTDGSIVLTIYKSDDISTVIGTVKFLVNAINTEVLIVNTTNPLLLEAINNCGMNPDHEIYYLKEQAHSVSDASFAALINYMANDDRYRSGITSLNELSEFTSVTTLPNKAFASKTGKSNFLFSEIKLPINLTYIPTYCFSYCTNIKSIIIPASVKYIENYAFLYCSNLNTVNFDENSICESIGANAFEWTEQLKDLNLSESLTTLGGSMLRGSGIKNVLIPAYVSSIGENFLQLTKVTTLKVDDNNTLYTSKDPEDNECNAILSHDKTTLYVGCSATNMFNGIIQIANKAFNDVNFTGDSSNLVIIPDSVETIGQQAFMNNYSIKNVKFPNNPNFKVIGREIFRENNLEHIIIPDSVEEIGEYAFMGNRSCVDISIGKNLKTISSHNPFGYCRAVNDIYVSSENTHFYTTENKILFNEDSLCYVANGLTIDSSHPLKNYIPSSISNIMSYTFYQYNISDINLYGTNITYIGDFAFCNDTDVIYIILNDKITNLLTSTFQGCKNVETISIYASDAPNIRPSTWGSSSDTTGYNKKSIANHNLNVQTNATGYDGEYWNNYLLNPSYGGFKLSKTLSV